MEVICFKKSLMIEGNRFTRGHFPFKGGCQNNQGERGRQDARSLHIQQWPTHGKVSVKVNSRSFFLDLDSESTAERSVFLQSCLVGSFD
uniref:Uncharacterized protein n=1 Tax=Nelumbo nucifera TaxID=4432 RepID=A0A822ZA67_NELNU|nr:TPA_asm: hypothetical protein HUJ06_014632 [Nelumbo nucifera]